jgi:predicted  nucleic acid-binding Zn-ribbon protein
MIRKFFKWFFSNSNSVKKDRITCIDEKLMKRSLLDILTEIEEKIEIIQKELGELKYENIELTNSIYECENRLESKIDTIHPVVYNIQSKLEN